MKYTKREKWIMEFFEKEIKARDEKILQLQVKLSFQKKGYDIKFKK